MFLLLNSIQEKKMFLIIVPCQEEFAVQTLLMNCNEFHYVNLEKSNFQRKL